MKRRQISIAVELWLSLLAEVLMTLVVITSIVTHLISCPCLWKNWLYFKNWKTV